MRTVTLADRARAAKRGGAQELKRRRVLGQSLAFVILMLAASGARAQVTRLEMLSREPLNGGQPAGDAGPYEIIRGKVHGEVDPADPHNTIIQDLMLAPRNARGRVEYVATFALAKPVDLTRASGTLVYQVVNRGNGTVTSSPEGHLSLVSGWQGDVVPTPANQTIAVPVAVMPDGSPVIGPVDPEGFERHALAADAALVDFWAPWCKPCEAIEPHLRAIAAENEGRLRLVRMNIDENLDQATRLAGPERVEIP